MELADGFRGLRQPFSFRCKYELPYSRQTAIGGSQKSFSRTRWVSSFTIPTSYSAKHFNKGNSFCTGNPQANWEGHGFEEKQVDQYENEHFERSTAHE